MRPATTLSRCPPASCKYRNLRILVLTPLQVQGLEAVPIPPAAKSARCRLEPAQTRPPSAVRESPRPKWRTPPELRRRLRSKPALPVPCCLAPVRDKTTPGQCHPRRPRASPKLCRELLAAPYGFQPRWRRPC